MTRRTEVLADNLTIIRDSRDNAIPKILVWMNYPSHYQLSFFNALKQSGVDLRVCFYERVTEARKALGWDSHHELDGFAQYVEKNLSAIYSIPDWDHRVHVIPGGHSNPFLRRLTGVLCEKGVQWMHWSERSNRGLFSLAKMPFKVLYARKINRHALGALAAGQMASSEFARWGVAREKIAIFPYSTPPKDDRAQKDETCTVFQKGRRAFLFVGTLELRKGVDILLNAFKKASLISDGWVLILVGNDLSGGWVSRLISRLGIGSHVLLRGVVPSGSMSSVYKCGDVLVLPSRHDGWGMVLSEAASHGLALVGSESAGASVHLIEPGVNGFRVKTGCIASLASVLSAYMNNPELAGTHGGHSFIKAEEFSPERNAQRFIDILKSWVALSTCSGP
jgi:glycosyltransferase involved in cell wall biosynthesis